jgi:hypothetical protein
MTALEDFRNRLAAEWLPSFCEARRERSYFADGFRLETVGRLSEFDARWFLAAVDARARDAHSAFVEKTTPVGSA